MKIINLSLAAVLFATLAMGSEEKSQINVSGNVVLASNYVWRGMTQTKDDPTVQGTVLLDYKGFYVGSTAANTKIEGIDASVELDVFGGYTAEMYGIGYDAGVAYYTYPSSSKEANFAEVYLGLSKDFEIAKIGAKFYRGVKTHDALVSNAWEMSLSVPMPLSVSFDALYGDYANYGNYYSVGFAKPINDTVKLTLSYTGINTEAGGIDENNIVAMMGVNF